MTSKNRGLGRGLSMLLSQPGLTQASPQDNEQHQLPCTLLQPGKYQPRGDIDESSLTELADSIKKQGLIQPIVVRAVEGGLYEIIAGERRWRASKLAGLIDVPVIIRQVDDETTMAIALIENLQREDLNAMDQARAMQRLTHDFGLTHQQVADLLSKSRTAVSNFIRLLQLDPSVIKYIEHGDLDMGHARCLLILTNEQQLEVAKLIIAKNLSVRETEMLVARMKEGKSIQTQPTPSSTSLPHFHETVTELSQYFKTKVKIKSLASGKGKLIIDFANEDKLKEVLIKLHEPSVRKG